MREITVRKATAEDVPRLAVTLARAFHDDPAFGHAVPGPARRTRYSTRYFEVLLRRVYLPKQETYTTDECTSVALWGPPGKWQVPLTATLAMAPVIVRACGLRFVPRVFRMLNLMEATHKQRDEPHWYLGFIATDPDRQGGGHGTALLNAMLDRCDAEGVPAYLESSSLANQALYHRHGFEVLEEMHWPDGGPPFWPMWRRPLGP